MPRTITPVGNYTPDVFRHFISRSTREYLNALEIHPDRRPVYCRNEPISDTGGCHDCVVFIGYTGDRHARIGAIRFGNDFIIQVNTDYHGRLENWLAEFNQPDLALEFVSPNRFQVAGHKLAGGDWFTVRDTRFQGEDTNLFGAGGIHNPILFANFAPLFTSRFEPALPWSGIIPTPLELEAFAKYYRHTGTGLGVTVSTKPPRKMRQIEALPLP